MLGSGMFWSCSSILTIEGRDRGPQFLCTKSVPEIALNKDDRRPFIKKAPNVGRHPQLIFMLNKN